MLNQRPWSSALRLNFFNWIEKKTIQFIDHFYHYHSWNIIFFSVILTSSAIAQNDPKILALGLRKTIKGYLSISEGMKHSLLNNAPNYKHNFENTYYHINIYLFPWNIFSEHGDIHALVGTEIPLYVYGSGLTNDTQVVFTSGTINYNICIVHIDL